MSVSRDSVSRPGSATSSLDPYYFGARSPSDSPAHSQSNNLLSITPETRTPNEPCTPSRAAAAIDRRGLVGVGELATPRWDKIQRQSKINSNVNLQDDSCGSGILEEDTSELVMVPTVDKDAPDSPWTIEAVDGEDDKDEVTFRLESITGY